MKVRLSKSKLILGLQCQKALYLASHRPDLADEVSDSQQLIFDQGHCVGVLAQSHYSGGILIDATYTESERALKQTQDAITSGALSIYEATFSHEDVLVKVDILKRNGASHAWEIIEVKSSTQVKAVHIPDAAVQLWVCRGAGLNVKSVSIMTINNQCTFPDLSNLFNLTDITKEADDFIVGIPTTMKAFKVMLASAKTPKIEIGKHCDDPYGCSFKTHCWSSCKIPAVSVFNIPRLSDEKKWAHYHDGKVDLKKLDPQDFNATQARMIEFTVSKKRFIDSKAISKAIKGWTYPMSFLDFETIGYAIPRYNGQRPYQQLPFQFSCHIRIGFDAELQHCEYLHMADTDPRESISRALVDLVPETGSVVAYNMGFESAVLKSLAEMFPKFKNRLLNIVNRLVDPLPIFRAHVYDPDFQGSFSIKNVAPALLGKSASYQGMAVGDGTEAQSVYLEMINPLTKPLDKEKLRLSLIEYCTKDTMGMVELVDWLQKNATAASVRKKGGV